MHQHAKEPISLHLASEPLQGRGSHAYRICWRGVWFILPCLFHYYYRLVCAELMRNVAELVPPAEGHASLLLDFQNE